MSMSVDAAGSSTLDPYQSSGQGNTQALQQLAQLEQLIQQLIAELQMFSQLNNLANQKPSPSVGGAGGGGGGMPEEMRSSIMLVPPLLARFGVARLESDVTGCTLGVREIDPH
ncbi:hypothetical protein QZM99_31540, partial [Burkholderia gladioli]|uniref:hypothetical protein n=1 Tax=Burkholderia gladioli TaxID=28095 RepID=UPI002653BAFC